MAESIFIGFDGGGSTSRFIVKNGENEPEIFSYPLNLKYTDIGIEDSVNGFVNCLQEILGEDILRLRGICISLSGASTESANKGFVTILRKKLYLPEFNINIESDSSFTLDAAYPNEDSGLLLIAGTGSVAIAKERNGKIMKIGGWGRFLGDEGSGYWIGLQTLRYYCRVLDGIEEGGDLFERVQQILLLEAGQEFAVIRRKLYRNEIKPQNFAPLVFNNVRDLHASDIIRDASFKLFNIITELWRKVKDECKPVITLHGQIAGQPMIYDYINEQSTALGLECKILEGKAVLQRALEMAISLAE